MLKVMSVFLLIIAPWVAQAELAVNVGVGKGLVRNQFGAHEQFERYASLGYSFGLSPSLYLKGEAGGWLAHGEGRKHNMYVAALIGLKVQSKGGLYVMAEIGPALISSPDSRLGSHYQFDIGFGGGLNVGGVGLGAKLKHFSNAGLKQPNAGVDAVCGELQLRL
jgi:hypothetical protein